MNISLDKTLDLTLISFAGDIGYSDIRDTITKYYQGTLTKYALWDFSEADVQTVSNLELRQLGEQGRRAVVARNNCFDLIVVKGMLKFGMARIYVAYSESMQKDPNSLKTLLFKSRDEAVSWVNRNELEGKRETIVQNYAQQYCRYFSIMRVYGSI